MQSFIKTEISSVGATSASRSAWVVGFVDLGKKVHDGCATCGEMRLEAVGGGSPKAMNLRVT